jgi:DnaJ-class molecular chaperone|mmetsp:Transcript_27727/g.39671  ORF Transcript_27727/g.39671 Transcript_27727/m.39671 type:complete len:176 (+) Transcript_27727:50-577(+)
MLLLRSILLLITTKISALGLSLTSFNAPPCHYHRTSNSHFVIRAFHRVNSPAITCLFAQRMPSLNPAGDDETSRVRRNLELRWTLLQSNDECDLEDMYSCGGPCDICQEEGTAECRFCHGTGFLTIGQTLYSGQDCPVCSGLGEEECKNCMGRKWVAKWRQVDPSLLAGGGNAKS